jgi:HEAT repeat protein
MAAIYDIFRRALALRDEAVDRAMAAALPTAEPRAKQLIGLSLLQRNRPVGTRALVTYFDRLPDSVQAAITDRAGELARPLREASQHGSAGEQTNALTIVERAQATRLAYLVAGRLRHGEPAVQAHAAASLQAMADLAGSDPRPGRPPSIAPVEAGYLAEAVEEALLHYSAHRQRPVLLAWLAMLPRPLDASMRSLAKPQHPAAAALAPMLEAAEPTTAARALPVLATVDPLRAAAQRGMRQAAASHRLGPVLAGYHFFAWRPAWRAIRAMRQPQQLWLDAEQRAQLAGHEARGLPAWAGALGFAQPERIECWAALREADDPATRLGALRRLIATADQPAEQRPAETTAAAHDAIAGFCHDPEPPVARIALNYLLRRDYADRARLLGELLNSPHPSIRQIAGRQFAPLGFARLWESWPRLDPARRRDAAHALMKLDDRFHKQLQQKLETRGHETRLRAINMVRELELGERFEARLRALTRETDEVVASAAAKALGSAGSDQAAAELERVLDHRSSRVRANAVEALDQLQSSRHVEQLTAMAHEDENRPRANAIRSLHQMRADQAMHALARMLSDERAEHRRSALWLVETLGLAELARQVSTLASDDPDPEVQHRARKSARQLLAGWPGEADEAPQQAG